MELTENIKNYALVGAVEEGDVKVVSKLLNEGADPNFVPKRATSTLMERALHEEDLKIIELLLRYGAEVENEFIKKIFNLQNCDNLKDLIAIILEKSNNDVNFMRYIFGILVKSRSPSTKILELLLDHRLPINDYMKMEWIKHGGRCTPFHIAIWQLNINFVSKLFLCNIRFQCFSLTFF